jgi:hypothetical protein
VTGRLSSCADAFSDLLSWNQPADDKDQRRLQGVIPGLIINGTAARPAGKKGKGRLYGTIALVGNKALFNLKDCDVKADDDGDLDSIQPTPRSRFSALA